MTTEGDKIQSFMRQVAEAQTTPGVHEALCQLTDTFVGVHLFTIMTFDRVRGVASRVYSNMPVEYPVSGQKRVESDGWTRQVLEQRQTFVANTIEGIAAVFPDHELIRSLGCESIINVPIEVCGEVLGTLNCLHEKNHYDNERVRAAENLKLPGALCLLMEKSSAKREARNG